MQVLTMFMMVAFAPSPMAIGMCLNGDCDSDSEDAVLLQAKLLQVKKHSFEADSEAISGGDNETISGGDSEAISGGDSEASCNLDTYDTKLGVISYWSPTQGYYETLQEGSLAVINPNNGIFDSTQPDTETLAPSLNLYTQVASAAAARGIRILGYVSTGYFDHSCNTPGVCQTLERINASVKQYFDSFTDLSGIFFDEVAPKDWDCGAFKDEYATLRNMVKAAKADAEIAFNTGIPDDCVVDGVESGEILVLYENQVSGYGETCDSNWENDALWRSTTSARQKGIQTWHLVHSANQTQALDALKKARHYGVDWFYATEIGGDWENGEHTWGQPPAYWDCLKAILHPTNITTVDDQCTTTTTTTTTSELVEELVATLSADHYLKSSNEKIWLTLKRPDTLCCTRWDWVGFYKKGSEVREAYVHSDSEEAIVDIPLDNVIKDMEAGEYELKYTTSEDGWAMHELDPTLTITTPTTPTTTTTTKSEFVEELVATLSVDHYLKSSNEKIWLTLKRPDTLCCSRFDWVGFYKKGSEVREAYVHSDSEEAIVDIPLDNIIKDMEAGEYELKYTTSEDGWAMHELDSTLTITTPTTPTTPTTTTSELVEELVATLSADHYLKSSNEKIWLTLKRPDTLCCSRFDWVGFYKKGSEVREAYVHSDSEEAIVDISLDNVIKDMEAGEYELKYTTSEDGWAMHELDSILTIQ